MRTTNFNLQGEKWRIEDIDNTLVNYVFTIFVSVLIIPCGVIIVYGALGEVYSFVTIEAERETQIVKEDDAKVRKEKGINVYNIWCLLCVIVLCIAFIEYSIRLQ